METVRTGSLPRLTGQLTYKNMNPPTFESDRIQELKNERIQLQKKTFSKWVNAFLEKSGTTVKDLFEDLSDGKILIKLLEEISGERVGAIARGKQRIHKLENVSKALQFLQKSVKLESIGPEDVVDGKEDLILGLIWMIILRFQISDVQKEQDSKDAKSAKEALLLWCQRKTKGYKGVDVKNFTSSWKNGLAFNALIHRHRPDLFDYNGLEPQKHSTNLSHAFNIANEKLGIAKLLDPEDVDCAMPDEKSVMTYVAMLYQYFAKMKNEETGGRRIAKILGTAMEIERMKEQYITMVTNLLAWIHDKTKELQKPLSRKLSELQSESTAFKNFRMKEKPIKYNERMDIEAHFFCIQTKINANKHKPYHPPEGKMMADINSAWKLMQEAEYKREAELRKELIRHEKLARIMEKFNRKAELRESWLEEISTILDGEEKSEETIVAIFNRHKAIEADVRARGGKFEALHGLRMELENEHYEDIAPVKARQMKISANWDTLINRLNKRTSELTTRKEVSNALDDVSALNEELKIFQAALDTEHFGQHLPELEDLLQKHQVLELELEGFQSKLPSLEETVLSIKPEEKRKTVNGKVQELMSLYKEVRLNASQRRQRLQVAREVYRFLDSVREEISFVKEKQQSASSKEVGKDLIGLTRLQKKHQILGAEVEACHSRCMALNLRGKELASIESFATSEINKLLKEMTDSLEILRESVDIRSERLSEASQSFQYYSDANDAESWLQEQLNIASNEDFGKDIQSTKLLLQAHEKVIEEAELFSEDLTALEKQCQEIEKVDDFRQGDRTKTNANQRKHSSEQLPSDTEEVSESEDPIVEVEIEREVVKEIKVIQAVALYPYSGQGLSLQEGEAVFVIKKTNNDWWTVRRSSSKEVGYAPAKYLKETAPKIIRKVTKEKVKVPESQVPKDSPNQNRRSSRTERRGSIQRNSSMSRKIRGKLPRRKRRFTAHFDRENVTNRQLAIVVMYDKLKKVVEERKRRLTDSLAYFQFCDEKEDALQWISDKIHFLKKSFESDDIQALQNVTKKFDAEIQAYQETISSLTAAARSLLDANTAYKEQVETYQKELLTRWEQLKKLLRERTVELQEKHGVEIFCGKCNEAHQWLKEKIQSLNTSQQLDDLETIRALQRRHQNLEREMGAFEETVRVLDAEGKRLCHDQPSSNMEVSKKLRSLNETLNSVKDQAALRRQDLENAYGIRGFMADYREILQWASGIKNFLQPRTPPANLESLREEVKEFEDKMDDTQIYLQRGEDLAAYGKKLMLSNPTSNLEEKIKEMESLIKCVSNEVETRKNFLDCNKELLNFLSDVDNILNSCKTHEAVIHSMEVGKTSEHVEKQLKKLADIVQKISQQQARFSSIYDNFTGLQNDYAGLVDKVTEAEGKVKAAFDYVKEAMHQKETALVLRMDFILFQNEAEEFLAWIADKQLIAKDQSFLDNTHIQGAILKQEALQAELSANEKGKDDILAAGQSLVEEKHPDTTQVKEIMVNVQHAWDELKDQCRRKSNQLNAATKERQFMNQLSDFDIWANQADQILSQDNKGNDLASAKFRRRRLSKLGLELEANEALVANLCSVASNLSGVKYYNADKIDTLAAEAKKRLQDISSRLKERETIAGESITRIDLLNDVADKISWAEEHLESLDSAGYGSDILEAQRFIKRHEATEAEIKFHRSQILSLIKRGNDFVTSTKLDDNELKSSLERLSNLMKSLEDTSRRRKSDLAFNLQVLQCMMNLEDAFSWLKEKLKVVEKQTFGHDVASAEAALARCKSLSSDITMYQGTITSLNRRMEKMMEENKSCQPHLSSKKIALTKDYDKVKKACEQRCKALEESLQFYQFFSDADIVHKWIIEKYKQISTDAFGADWEHYQILYGQFLEFKTAMATGTQDYELCLQLGEDMIKAKHPHAKKIEDTSNKLRSAYDKLQARIKHRENKLARAGQLHKFNMLVSDILSRMKEKQSTITLFELRSDLPGAERMIRRHRGICLDLNTMQKQIQTIQQQSKELQPQFTGQTKQQIVQYGNYAVKVWTDLVTNSKKIDLMLVKNLEFLRVDKEIQNLFLWCDETIKSITAKEDISSVADAESVMAKFEDVKLSIDTKEDKFTNVCSAGEKLIKEEHMKKDQISENLEALLHARDTLHQTWIEYNNKYSKEYDFQLFSKEYRSIENTISAQRSFLLIPEELKAVEEYEKIIKKYESYEKIHASVVTKYEALVSFGEEFNQIISERSDTVNAMLSSLKENLNSYSKKLRISRMTMQKLKHVSNFHADANEILSWIEDKFHLLKYQEGVERQSLSTSVQRHKVLTAEMSSYKTLVQKCVEDAKEFEDSEFFVKYGVKDLVATLNERWTQLEKETKEEGVRLQEAKEIGVFRRDVEFAGLFLQDKLSLLSGIQLGTTCDNTQIFERKLLSVEKDIAADKVRIQAVKESALRLQSAFPASLGVIESLVDTLQQRWEQLQSLLRNGQSEVNRDKAVFGVLMELDELTSNVKEKISFVSNVQLPTDVQLIKYEIKKHQGFEVELKTLNQTKDTSLSLAKDVSQNYEFKKQEIQAKAGSLSEEWDRLMSLVASRKSELESARNMSSFDIEVSSLLIWMDQMCEKLNETVIPRTVKEGKNVLKKNQDILTEFKLKDAVLNQLSETGQKLALERGLSESEVSAQITKLRSRRETLGNQWEEKNKYLTQCYYFQKFTRDAIQIEAWLSRQEKDLEDSEVGNNLEEVTLLMSKLRNIEASLEKHLQSLRDLKEFATNLIEGEHHQGSEISSTVDDLWKSIESVCLKKEDKRRALEKVMGYFQLLKQVNDMIDWIKSRLTYAEKTFQTISDDFHDKRQLFQLFEIEVVSNEQKLEDLSRMSKQMIDSVQDHQPLQSSVETLTSLWAQLTEISIQTREAIVASKAVQDFESELDKLSSWLEEAEKSLNSEDHGKDLKVATFLLRQHDVLSSKFLTKSEKVVELESTLTSTDVGEIVKEKFHKIQNRFEHVSAAMGNRSQALQESIAVHQYIKLLKGEENWIKAKEPLVDITDIGSDLTACENLSQNHRVTESDIDSHFIVFEEALMSIDQDKIKDENKKQKLNAYIETVTNRWKQLVEKCESRKRRLEFAESVFKYIAEVNNCCTWLQERSPLLQTEDCGADEDTAQTLLHSHEALVAELQNFTEKVESLKMWSIELLETDSIDFIDIERKQINFEKQYQEMCEIADSRTYSLKEAVSMFHYLEEADALELWINAKMSEVYTDDCGTEVDQAELLLREFEDFARELVNNEDRIAVFNGLAQEMLDSEHTQSEIIELRSEEICDLWMQLRYAAQLRLRSLEDARNTFAFSNEIQETINWIKTKQKDIISCDLLRDKAVVEELDRKHELFMGDFPALKEKVQDIKAHAEYFRTEFPSMIDSIDGRVSEMESLYRSLIKETQITSEKLAQTWKLKQFFEDVFKIRSWMEEFLNTIAGDVEAFSSKTRNAESSRVRYQEYRSEAESRSVAILSVSKQARELMSLPPLIPKIVDKEISSLEENRKLILQHLDRFYDQLNQSKNTESLETDFNHIDNWISSKQTALDERVGETLEDVLDLLKDQEEFESSLAVQEELLNAALKRCDAFEAKVKAKSIAQSDELPTDVEVRNDLDVNPRKLRKRSSSNPPLPSFHSLDEDSTQPKTDLARTLSNPEHAVLRRQISDDVFSNESFEDRRKGISRDFSIEDSGLFSNEIPAPFNSDNLPKIFITDENSVTYPFDYVMIDSRPSRKSLRDFDSIDFAGILERKTLRDAHGRKCLNRSWKSCYVVLSGDQIYYYRTEKDFKKGELIENPTDVSGALCEIEASRGKRENVLRLRLSNRAECLLSADFEDVFDDLVMAVTEATGQATEEESSSFGSDQLAIHSELMDTPPPRGFDFDDLLFGTVKHKPPVSYLSPTDFTLPEPVVVANTRQLPSTIEDDNDPEGVEGSIFDDLVEEENEVLNGTLSPPPDFEEDDQHTTQLPLRSDAPDFAFELEDDYLISDFDLPEMEDDDIELLDAEDDEGFLDTHGSSMELSLEDIGDQNCPFDTTEDRVSILTQSSSSDNLEGITRDKSKKRVTFKLDGVPDNSMRSNKA